MAEPLPGTDAHATRRERRADRTRRRWKRAFTVVACVVGFVAFALVATETVRLGSPERPSLARTVDSTTPASTLLTPATTIPGRPCRSPLVPDDPLRLWIGGDSLAGSLGPALGAMTGGTGVVQPYFDSRVSSGLSNPGFFDWPSHATKEMARLEPEIAVFIIGANDYPVPLDDTPDERGEPAWKAAYTAMIEETLAVLDPATRTVVWIGSPPFKDSRNAEIKELDDLTREVIGRQAKNAVYVDAYTLFTDAEGNYQGSLPPLDDPDGEPVVVRSGDGVHFTAAGADRLAQAVFALVDVQCKVSAQAVAGVVKQPIQTPGSTQVVSGTGRGGGTVQTSPPATSSPATTPPPTTAAPVPTQPTTATDPQPASTTTTAPSPPNG